MTKAILIRKTDNAVVGSALDTLQPRWIVDPVTGAKLASPASIGWENDDYRMVGYQDAAPPPAGKRAVSKSAVYDDKTDKAIETAALEDVPPARVLTDAERLEDSTGLTIAQIKAALA